MPPITTFDTLASAVKRAFVLTPPASLLPYSEHFWVVREDEPEVVTDGRHNYLWCGFGNLALLATARLKNALVFRAPTAVKGQKRSTTIDELTWNQDRVFRCGIAAIPMQEHGKYVVIGGFTAAFCVVESSGVAVLQMLPDRHYSAEISRLMYDTASHLLPLLTA